MCHCSVKIMAERLDPEGLGVVLLHAFMDEFYPHEKSSTPDVFTLWHYNGLSCSNSQAKVNKTVFFSFHHVLFSSFDLSVCRSHITKGKPFYSKLK